MASIPHQFYTIQEILGTPASQRSEEHTSELQSHLNLVCRLLLEKKKKIENNGLDILKAVGKEAMDREFVIEQRPQYPQLPLVYPERSCVVASYSRVVTWRQLAV